VYVLPIVKTTYAYTMSIRAQWRIRKEEVALRHIWCGAPVDCCHCLTEILYLYCIFIECSGKFRVYNKYNNSLQHM
jgi:hypothetical protein